MKKKFKGIYLLVSSIIIALLQLPFAFAKSATGKIFYHPKTNVVLAGNSNNTSLAPAMISVYDSLHLALSGLSKKAYDYAKKGFEKLIAEGKIANESIIAIADFSQSSDKKRLYVIDLKKYKVLFNTYVAHGRNSGREMAESFSNQPESFKSSPGFYVTGTTYNGKNGYSLKLDGLEKGINDQAYERTIVMHGAEYVNAGVARDRGWVGRSWGCPAVPVNEAKPIINTLKNGSCLFIYAPAGDYISRSTVLNS
jgi:hypothetical protein